jgi:hypothetical protein
MPTSARRADQYAIVRTMAHTHNDHDASQWMLSGYFYTPIAQTLQYPSMGSVFSRVAGSSGPVPPYWHMPLYGKFVVKAPEGFGAGYLGRAYDPILVEGDPNQPGFHFPGLSLPEGMSPERVSRRQSLLGRLDDAVRSVEQAGTVATMDRHYQQAFDLVSSSAVRQAFQLDREDPRTRDRYGRNQFGQCTLLARRLVEAGARFVNVRGPGSSFAWDTHARNFTQHKNDLVPPMDTAFAALLDDLAARGLLETTLVLLMGEFGRTPKINANAGRDHWQYCYSVAIAGGGVQGGHVVGESDSQGAYPRTSPYWPQDLCATVYRQLGIDWTRELSTPDGRPMRVLPDPSRPIMELFG